MDQNNFQTPVPVFQKNRILPVIISVIVTAFVVGLGVFYFVNSSNLEEVEFLQKQIDELKNGQTNSSNDAQLNDSGFGGYVPIPGSVLLVKENEQQNPPPSNPGNLVNEYFILSYNPTTQEEKQIALVKNNFFTEPFGFSNNKIFFVTPTGELGSLDIKSGKQETVKIPGLIPTNEYLNKETLSDFLVSDNNIFYLKGDCSEGEYCALGQYDLVTGNNQIIIDNLHKQVSPSMFNVIHLDSFDSIKNTLKIIDSGGDGGFGFVSLYDFDLKTKTLTKVDSATSEYCGEDESDCSPEQKAENERFDNIFTKPQISCNGTIFEGAKYIGCVK